MRAVRRRASYANVMSTIAVFLALTGGAWAVRSAATGPATIRACVSKRTGAVRLPASGKRCATGERSVSWNRRGPAGPQGGAGAAGAPGAPGAAGRAGTDAQFAGAAAGGDLTGTYPAPLIGPLTVGTAELADGAVTGAKVAPATITAGGLANATITGGKVAPGTLTGSNLAANTVTGTQIDESTLVGVVTGASAATQIAPGGGAGVISFAPTGTTITVGCTQAGANTGATVAYGTNASAPTAWITRSAQVQGVAPASTDLAGDTVGASDTFAPSPFTAAQSATTDRAVRVVYDVGGDSLGGHMTQFVVTILTNYAGGNSCVARAQVIRS